MAMFSFVEKIKEKIFKGKQKQEISDRKKTDEYIGKSHATKKNAFSHGSRGTHRRNHSHPLWRTKPGRKMAREKIFGGAAYRVTANSTPEKRREARRALA